MGLLKVIDDYLRSPNEICRSQNLCQTVEASIHYYPSEFGLDFDLLERLNEVTLETVAGYLQQKHLQNGINLENISITQEQYDAPVKLFIGESNNGQL